MFNIIAFLGNIINPLTISILKKGKSLLKGVRVVARGLCTFNYLVSPFEKKTKRITFFTNFSYIQTFATN